MYMFKDLAHYIEEVYFRRIIKLAESLIHLLKTCGLSNNSRLIYCGIQYLIRLGQSPFSPNVSFLRKNSVGTFQETLPIGFAVTWLPCYCLTNRL